MIERARWALALAAIAWLASAGPARAADAEGGDYDPRSTAWNGMASFVGLAEGMGFTVAPVSSLEWSELVGGRHPGARSTRSSGSTPAGSARSSRPAATR